MRINLDDQESIEPNMAPLLDCIFLLLIFFLVATSFEQQKRDKEIKELDFTLPSSAAAIEGAHNPDQMTVITIDRKGRLMLNNHRISTNELHAALKQLAATNPQTAIRIDGDRDTPLQHVVHLLDLCEFEGLNNIAVRAASDAEY